MGKERKHHAIVKDLPVMSGDDFESLKADIADHFARLGRPFQHKIVLLDDQILDGRHRERAARELKIELKPGRDFVDYDRKNGEPLDWVMSQMQHRNRTPSIKTVEVALLVDHWPASRGDGEKVKILAERFKVAEVNVKRVRQLRREARGLFDDIAAGKLNINQAFNRFRHHDRTKQVRKIRGANNAGTIADCRIIVGDAIDKLEALPSKSVKCVFIDPPYNIGIAYHGDKTGDRIDDKKFVEQLCLVLQQCARILSDDGSIFVMMPARYAFELQLELAALKLHYRNTIAWVETFGNYQEGNLAECWRPILYFTRSQKFIWNPDVRIESDRQAKYGDARANPHGKLVSNVWQIPRVQGTSSERVPFADAPPQLPVEIPQRCILLSTDPGDTVLDCFSGNGTTGVAALLNGRKYIGIERSKKYAGQSEQWIASQLAQRKEGE